MSGLDRCGCSSNLGAIDANPQLALGNYGGNTHLFHQHGAPPTRLTLNSTTGVISGAATAASTFFFTVTPRDSDGFTTTQSYSITVNKQASQTTVSASPSAASPAQTVTRAIGE